MDRAVVRRTLAAVGAALAVALLAASAVLAPGLPKESGRGYSAVAAQAVAVADAAPPAPKPVYRPAMAPPGSTWVATLSAATPYSRVPEGSPVGTLPATSPFGAANVVAVLGNPDSLGWLHVELPVRPNGSLGWIPPTGVTLTYTSYKVEVHLASRTLTIIDGGRVVLTTSVAVGAPRTPTPPGNTYLWELIRPDDPTGAYGPYIFGLAWFSDAYSVFNGGDAQIGIHGQDEPWSIGQAASHGCVRLPNDVIAKLAGTLPLGTPVTIS